MLKYSLLFLMVLAFDACKPKPASDWNKILEYLSTADTTTTRTDLITRLGAPYEEYDTPSLHEEHVMNFPVPNEPDSAYWVMIDTYTHKFLYWSHVKMAR